RPHRGAARGRSHAVLRLAQRERPASLLHARALPRQGKARARRPHRHGARQVQQAVRNRLMTNLTPDLTKVAATGFDKLLSVQRPVVRAHWRGIRRGRPAATPEQVIRTLERRSLTAVTTGGAAVGASAALPVVGIGTSMALSAVETGGFLEASALY